MVVVRSFFWIYRKKRESLVLYARGLPEAGDDSSILLFISISEQKVGLHVGIAR